MSQFSLRRLQLTSDVFDSFSPQKWFNQVQERGELEEQ